MKNKWGLSLITIILGWLLLTSCTAIKALFAGESGNMEVVLEQDEQINTAIARAKDTLPLFIEVFESPNSDQSTFSLKVAFPYTLGEGNEHLWVSDLSYSKEQFTGIIGNEPVFVKGLKLGDEVTVNTDSITDWIIITNGKVYGGFTIYAFRERMSESEKEGFDEETDYMFQGEPLLPE